MEPKDLTEIRNAGALVVTRRFYERFGAKMIRELFPEYEKRIAVGLVGEGSECFGFDDKISRDHDFGLGFCMWLNKQDFARIGKDLQKAYDSLIANEGEAFSRAVWGEQKGYYNTRLSGRRGVMEIEAFYESVLKMEWKFSVGKGYWVYVEPRFLAAAVNGEVFRDDEGVFTSVRERILSYYPKSILRLRLAEALHQFSHGGQSNYPRMMARKDLAAARLCIDQAIQSAMNIAYLLARRYPPYYKWIFRGLLELPVLPELPDLITELSGLALPMKLWETITYDAAVVFTQDPVISLIEKIAAVLLEEMNRQGFVHGTELFLESYVKELSEENESEENESEENDSEENDL